MPGLRRIGEEAIFSIAAARSSAPCSGSVEAAAACREALRACSAEMVIWRAACRFSHLRQDGLRPIQDRLIGEAQCSHIRVYFVEAANTARFHGFAACLPGELAAVLDLEERC